MQTTKTLPATADVTPEMIEGWKQQYGEIFKITVEDKAAFLKKPSRKTLSYASSIGTKDPFKFNEIILKECMIAGDREILESDDYFMAAGGVLDGVLKFKEAELEKL